MNEEIEERQQIADRSRNKLMSPISFVGSNHLDTEISKLFDEGRQHSRLENIHMMTLDDHIERIAKNDIYRNVGQKSKGAFGIKRSSLQLADSLNKYASVKSFAKFRGKSNQNAANAKASERSNFNTSGLTIGQRRLHGQSSEPPSKHLSKTALDITNNMNDKKLLKSSQTMKK